MTRIHATCVAIGGRGVLLSGPPGAGKSDLALRLIDRGAALVSDDGVEVRPIEGRLEASAPDTIAGLIEVRGVGIVTVAAAGPTEVLLAVALDRMPERLPAAPPTTRLIEGVAIPEIAIAPFEASAPLKVERALAAFGRMR